MSGWLLNYGPSPIEVWKSAERGKDDFARGIRLSVALGHYILAPKHPASPEDAAEISEDDPEHF